MLRVIMTTYYIHQKITAFANQYRVYQADGDKPGPMIAFAHQKRLALKEEIIFYTDETKNQIAFRLKARKVLELAGTYDVTDDSGEVLGTLRKQFEKSLMRSTWNIYKAQQDDIMLVVQERSAEIALLRRVWSFIPFIGEFPFPVRFHFDFIDPILQANVATYNKITLLRDHYQLQAEDAVLENIDWRVLVAQGVALDALQGR